jgi:hypothetical protein
MLIKICASGVSFVRVLNSTSFDEINTLNEYVMSETIVAKLDSLSHRSVHFTYHFLVCIFILNNNPNIFSTIKS